MYRRKIKQIGLLTIFFVFFVASMCSARQGLPFLTGIVVNNNNQVIGVNVNGPGYNAGIRPNDTILKIKSKEIWQPESSIRDYIDTKDSQKVEIRYQRGEEVFTVPLKTEKLKDQSVRSTILVLGDAETNYKGIQKACAFDPVVSTMLPIKYVDENLKLITTEGTASKSEDTHLSEYITGLGLGATSLKTNGSISIKDDEKNPGCSLLKANLSFEAWWICLFGETHSHFNSTGILEHELVQHMYD